MGMSGQHHAPAEVGPKIGLDVEPSRQYPFSQLRRPAFQSIIIALRLSGFHIKRQVAPTSYVCALESSPMAIFILDLAKINHLFEIFKEVYT